MRTLIKLVPLALLGGAVAVQQACGSIPNDTGADQFPVSGVIRGSVVYNGPPPCTQNGQVVGNAIIFVFDRRNPPPPAGLANTAVNFGVVSGDALFGSIPRTAGATKVCPAAGAANVFASAPYIVAPMAAGSYVVQAFYDYTGNFLPTFDFRKLPEATDVGGGYIDLGDANKLVPDITQPAANETVTDDAGVSSTISVYPLATQSSNPSYQPVFLPVNVGNVVAPADPKSLRGIPTFALPPEGYIADNVTAFIGSNLTFARPYFYPEGVDPQSVLTAQNQPAYAPPTAIVANGLSTTPPSAPVKTQANPSGDVDYVPVLSFPQDIAIYSQPQVAVAAAAYYQESFPQLKLHWMGDANNQAELAIAADTVSPDHPFHLQLLNPAPAGDAPGGNGGLFVFLNQTNRIQSDFQIPEGTIFRMWPLVVLAKLEDDPTHANDPQSLAFQGADLAKPIVIVQGITLTQDSIYESALDPPDPTPKAANLTDHVTVLLRPAALCLDPRHTDLGGTLVTPYQFGPSPPNPSSKSASPTPGPVGSIFNPSVITNPQLTSLIKQDGTGAVYGCLPTGRYAINVVYPTGQAWTTPNEMGSCATAEGATSDKADPGQCTLKVRPVLRSQGNRAVVEITPASNPANCVATREPIFASAADGGLNVGPTWGDPTAAVTIVPGVPSACTTLTGN